MPVSSDYSALRETAVLGAIAARRQIAIAGPDRADFLQGLLSNDILALTAGRGCYAAWLTPQGRMICDLHVLESGDMILLDLPADEAEAAAARFEQFHFSEDISIANLAGSLAAVWLHGPQAAAMLAGLGAQSGAQSGARSGGEPVNAAPDFGDWLPYQNARVELAGTSVAIARIDQLGVPGFAIYVDVGQEPEVTQSLIAAGAVPATGATLEAARIESGYPKFGVDMTSDTIPLEAGIEDRAISLTKGCYVGQEVIIRVLHRGHGRVARKLVRLGGVGVVPGHGAKIMIADKEIGFITSAAVSPALGPIAMGYVHRDFFAAGTMVDIVSGEGRFPATVLPTAAVSA